jgi:hypothetical protein
MNRTVNLDAFGDWSLSEQVFGWILAHIPRGGVIFELGFGRATGELVRAGYVVYSVEHCGVWADKRHEIVGDSESHVLIQVPIVAKWYDANLLKKSIPAHYDLLIVDGPDTVDRGNMIQHMPMFNNYSAVVIDDYCELYDTAKIGAYFTWKNGGAVEHIGDSNKSALCIGGRGRGH